MPQPQATQLPPQQQTREPTGPDVSAKTTCDLTTARDSTSATFIDLTAARKEMSYGPVSEETLSDVKRLKETSAPLPQSAHTPQRDELEVVCHNLEMRMAELLAYRESTNNKSFENSS